MGQVCSYILQMQQKKPKEMCINIRCYWPQEQFGTVMLQGHFQQKVKAGRQARDEKIIVLLIVFTHW